MCRPSGWLYKMESSLSIFATSRYCVHAQQVHVIYAKYLYLVPTFVGRVVDRKVHIFLILAFIAHLPISLFDTSPQNSEQRVEMLLSPWTDPPPHMLFSMVPILHTHNFFLVQPKMQPFYQIGLTYIKLTSSILQSDASPHWFHQEMERIYRRWKGM